MRSNRVAVFLLSVIVAAVGCQKRVPIAALPPAAPPSPTVSATVPALDEANRVFASSSYDEAARAYENYLRATSPGTGQRDQALFNLALTYALRPATAADWQRVATTFKQLFDEFPDSPLKASANLVLSLHAEVDQMAGDVKQRDQRIKQLTTELDRLKKIDADRRKRP